MAESNVEVPGDENEDSVFKHDPPALPVKRGPSFMKKEGLLLGLPPSNKPAARPVPKPRKNVKAASPGATSPSSFRPVPRPRTSSKDKLLEEVTERSVNHGKVVETNLDDFVLPPDADEVAKSVEDMVAAEFASPKPQSKNPVYDFEEFVGNRSTGASPAQNVLQPEIVSIGQSDGYTAGNSGKADSSLYSSDDVYENMAAFGMSRSEPDGATEPGDPSDEMYQVMSPVPLQQPYKFDSADERNLFSSNQQARASFPQWTNLSVNRSNNTVRDSTSSVTLEDLMNERRLSDGQSNPVYESLWVGKGKLLPPIPPIPSQKPVLSKESNVDEESDDDTFIFVPGKTTFVKPNLRRESSTDEAVPKLNIQSQWGEYIALDPRASIVYEKSRSPSASPPPLPPEHPPPPLPADMKARVSSAPPVPPRPSPNLSRSSDQSNDSQPEVPQTPSAVFDGFDTPVKPMADDPFQDTSFQSECYQFNKFGKARETQAAATDETYESFDEMPDLFDPFGLGIPDKNTSSSSQWAAEAVSPASSKSGAAAEYQGFNRVRLSQVPPPVHPETLYSRVIKPSTPSTPRDNIYSVAHDMEQSIDSSDSSEDPLGMDLLPLRTDGSGLSIPSVPIISRQVTVRRTEKCGYLMKQGGVRANRGWRRRWVVFNGRDLRYYINNRTQISQRVIPLACMKTVELDIRPDDTRRYKFKLITSLRDRVFIFAADKMEDCILWSQTLMAEIDKYQKQNGEDSNTNGSFSRTPEKEGYVRFENQRKKYYVSVEGSRFAYYPNIEDCQMGSPIHEIGLELASVKDISKGRLQLSTHYTFFVLQFESATEAQQWKMAIEDGIAEGLADDSVLKKVYENDSNRICADCESENPHWASINMGIVVCKKCAGIHRMFEAKVSKIRSLRMDTKVWTPSLIELMKAVGNANANSFWESELMSDLKISADASPEARKSFIFSKYKNKQYCSLHSANTDPRLLNEELLRVAASDDLMELMKLVFSGADVQYRQFGGNGETAFQITKANGKRLLMEFLFQNGGDLSAADMFENDEGRLREDVRYQGVMFKTGPNHRGFDRRWCVLEHATLAYYASERSTTAKDNIERQCIYCLQEVTMDRQPYSFEISTSKGGNRVYLFAAESSDERITWLQSLAKLICPIPMMDHVGMIDFSLGGNFYLKEIVTEDWRMSWIMLRWRLLYYMDANKTLQMVDLRKAMSIKYQDIEHGCKKCVETGHHFVINAPNRALYIQADLTRDTERAYNACERAIKDSGRTLEDQQLTSEQIPVIIDRCINHITMTGLKSKGIYRQSATQSRIQNLLAELKKDARAVKLEEYTCDEVANALKRFFRGLEDSLFTKDGYQEWIDTASVSEHSNKLAWYRYLISKLPLVNQNVLKKLVLHLHKVALHSEENRMSQENLATCFAPTLMKTDSMEAMSSSTLGREMAVLTDIIESHENVLQVNAQEKQRENEIEIAKERINQLQETQRQSVPTVLDSVLVTVHMFSIDGSCEQINMPCKASTLTLIMAVQKKCNMAGQFMMSEILKEGALERLLPLTDEILPVLHSWSNLGDEICRSAKLCFKKLDLLEKIQNSLNPDRAMFGEARFSDREQKKFSKQVFQLKQGKLMGFSSTKSTKPANSWNVEDLIIYHGIDPGRSAARSSYGFTFVVKGEPPSKNYFGRSICFSTEEEMMKWTAAVLLAQHPEGIIAAFS